MKQSKLLYIISAIITIAVAIFTFTSLPEKIIIGGETKPSFYLVLLSLLPIFSTLLCMEAKDYKGLGLLLYFMIYFILLKVILDQVGINIPMTLVGGFALVIGSLLLGLHLMRVTTPTKIAVNLAWINTEESYRAVQTKGARVFFIYSALQTLTLILLLTKVISVNLTFIIPLVAFAISMVVMLKSSVKLK